jgi:hypothetical protein
MVDDALVEMDDKEGSPLRAGYNYAVQNEEEVDDHKADLIALEKESKRKEKLHNL